MIPCAVSTNAPSFAPKLAVSKGFTRWLAAFAPTPAFRECVNVLFPGTEEIQKVHAQGLPVAADVRRL